MKVKVEVDSDLLKTSRDLDRRRGQRSFSPYGTGSIGRPRKYPFGVMREAHWHQFQVLTKRSERLLELDADLAWPENVWMGVSVENGDYTYRIEHLRKTRARTKFLSIEPLLGPVGPLPLAGIDWLIVGGESGPGARPMDEAWVLDIRDQCRASRIAFFFKQWGGVNKKKTGRLLQGETYEEMPAIRQVG